MVIQLLEKHFTDLVDANFTARMESSLDDIAEGKQDSLPYLRQFYFGEQGLKERIARELERIQPEEAKALRLPTLPDTVLRIGRFGPYLEGIHPRSKTPIKVSLPEDIAPADLTPEALDEFLKKTQQGPTTLGEDPATGKQIYLKTGAYGPYLQLGEDPEEESKLKPKRVSIPKQIAVAELDRTKALALLSLPRILGKDMDGKTIKAGLGRFGPYVQRETDFRSIKGEDDVLSITLERALVLLAEPKGRGRTSPGKVIGNHPEDGKAITVHDGKFGAYVKCGSVNATIPKEIHKDTITVEQAVALLAERAAKGPSKRRRKSA
jgi:DNA topoisomerase-1